MFQPITLRRAYPYLKVGTFILALIITLFGFGVTHVARAAGSTWTVTTTDDSVNDSTCSTSCTLREAINAANADSGTSESIVFANGVTGTITLNASYGGLTLSNATAPTTITGPGASSLAIDGSAINSTVIGINGAVTVTLSGLT